MPRIFQSVSHRLSPPPLREWPLQTWFHLLLTLTVLSSCILGAKLILDDYREYTTSKQNHIDLQNLNVLLKAANQISGERGPTNFFLAAPNAASMAALQEYRHKTDQALSAAATIPRIASDVVDVQRALEQLRIRIDALAASTPIDQKEWQSLLVEMFALYDDIHAAAMKTLAWHDDKNVYSHTSITLITLSELRDNAGRLGSYIVMTMMEDTPTPASLYIEFERIYGKVQYMGKLVLAETASSQDAEVLQARENVTRKFFVDGMALLQAKLEERKSGNLSRMTSTEFTRKIVPTFVPLTQLRDTYATAVLNQLTQETSDRKHALIAISILTFIILLLEFWLLTAAKIYLFRPLLQAKNHLLAMAQGNIESSIDHRYSRGEMYQLYGALDQLRLKLIERNTLDKQRVNLTMQLQRLADTDSLTGALNRRGMDDLIQRYISQHALPQKLCLILIDIDHFKQINDTYGHDCGDMVLKEVARRLQAGLRGQDALARFGGDEFAILLIDQKSQAVEISHRLKQMLESSPCLVDEHRHIQVTGSFGVAAIDQHTPDWPHLLKAADLALYRAKHAGRNRVEFDQLAEDSA